MASSRDQAIVAAIVAALVSAGVAGGRIYECRGESITGDDLGLAAVDVMPLVTQSQPLGSNGVLGFAGGALRHELQVAIKVIARENGTDPATRTIDPIVVAAHAALMADATLGGLARQITLTQRRWVPYEAGGQYLSVEFVYTVAHATRSADLTFGI